MTKNYTREYQNTGSSTLTTKLDLSAIKIVCIVPQNKVVYYRVDFLHFHSQPLLKVFPS